MTISARRARIVFFVLCMLLIPQPARADAADKIAFTSTRDNGNLEIYVMNGDGTGQTRLTNNSFDDQDPYFSNDGKQIVFSSNRDGNSEIYIMNADGTGQTRLTNDPAPDRHPTIFTIEFTDGEDSEKFSEIFFTRQVGTDEDLYALFSGEDEAVNVSTGLDVDQTETTPHSSRLGQRVFFAHNPAGNFNIHSLGFNEEDEFGEEQWTDNAADDIQPAPSPNGARLAFVSDRKVADDLDIFSGPMSDPDGTGTVNLTSLSLVPDTFPTWSPDSGEIAFTRGAVGARDIYVMNSDGTDPRPLTATTTGEDFDPSFQGRDLPIDIGDDQDTDEEDFLEALDALNCADFQRHEDAQRVLNADRNDPNRLDPDNDGIACEELLTVAAAARPVAVQPRLTG